MVLSMFSATTTTTAGFSKWDHLLLLQSEVSFAIAESSDPSSSVEYRHPVSFESNCQADLGCCTFDFAVLDSPTGNHSHRLIVGYSGVCFENDFYWCYCLCSYYLLYLLKIKVKLSNHSLRSISISLC